MNIFILSENPYDAAVQQCDKHVVKMPTESAQMLSTAHRLLDGTMELRPSKSGKRKVKYWKLSDEREDVLYKNVHESHPCTLWTMESEANYRWHFAHFEALSMEYQYRYGKEHGAWSLLKNVLATAPRNIARKERTEFRLAMKDYPECIVEGDPVQSYRNFYRTKQARFTMAWKNRPTPEWFCAEHNFR